MRLLTSTFLSALFALVFLVGPIVALRTLADMPWLVAIGIPIFAVAVNGTIIAFENEDAVDDDRSFFDRTLRVRLSVLIPFVAIVVGLIWVGTVNK